MPANARFPGWTRDGKPMPPARAKVSVIAPQPRSRSKVPPGRASESARVKNR